MRGLAEGELYRASVTLLKLVKKQRGTVNHDGEKWRKQVRFCVKILTYRWQLSVVTLEHGTYLHRVSQLGNPFVSLSHYQHLSRHTPLSHSENTLVIVVLWVGFHVLIESNAAKSACRAKLNVQEKSAKSHVYHIVSVLFQLCFSTSHHNLYYVACRWWGKHHGPPSTNLFLSTPTHHPGRRSRNLSAP